MPISTGTRLGPYEILAPLGAGGMGEVYSARDTRLGRVVALKVLPAALAHDSDYMARFQREAQMLASLNHANIATIYGVEESNGVCALAMELVEGLTLEERIGLGPLALDESLGIAKQIAEALEAAHEKGIIHRDLKPANVKVTPEGVVKVLDFGLAKTADATTASGDAVNSPTITMRATQAGLIMGTAGYMSPEQAAGKPLDKRADIWSFGVVLWEMLTGQRLFEGETISHTLAHVLTAVIDFGRIPGTTPGAIRSLLQRCLDRDVKTRLRDIGEARVAIQRWLANPAAEAPNAASLLGSSWISRAGWIAAALLAVIAGVALWFLLRPTLHEPRMVVRFENKVPVADVEGGLALSPDGSRLAFVGGTEQQIYVRMMDQLEAKPLAGTQGARFISFSPDGQWISFITSDRARRTGIGSPDDRLKKIAMAGGPAQILADAPSRNSPPIQNWGEDDNILFNGDGVLQRVSSRGGQVQTLAKPDEKKGERFFTGSQLLPDGQSILVSVSTGTILQQVEILNPQTGERKILLERAGVAHYVPVEPGSTTGHIVYFAPITGSLMAVAFDAARLEVKGSPVVVLEGVHAFAGPFGSFALSESGTLAYLPGAPREESARTLVWVDRKGVEQTLALPRRQYANPRLSPDGQRVVVSIQDPTAGRADIWVYDLARGAPTRITFGNFNALPLWTPDGNRLIYASGPNQSSMSMALLSLPADGSSPASVLLPNSGIPDAISSDGKLVILRGNREGGGNTMLVLPLADAPAAGAKPRVILDTPFTKLSAQFSPDGRFIAYQSDDTGRNEIYVQPYPGPGAKWTLSTDGGTVPRWARSGRELFYRNRDKMMAVDVALSPAFRAATPRVLFEGRYSNNVYDVSPDGRRFLMIKAAAVEQPPPDQLHVVVNWSEELRRRAAPGSK